MSHPTWVCGLKLVFNHITAELRVTPYVGVWIETLREIMYFCIIVVTPYVGVWIETFGDRNRHQVIESHPTWVCGLKP